MLSRRHLLASNGEVKRDVIPLNPKASSKNYGMHANAAGTAKIVKFFNDLFDSLNSSETSKDQENGNRARRNNAELKCAVNRNSMHMTYWRECVQKMKNMYFQAEGTTEKIVPPSLKNFIATVEGFMDMVKILYAKKVDNVYTREFNQDPLENFFGQIRQHRGRANSLNATQFEESFKTLLVRNVSGKHSSRANCQDWHFI